MDLDIAAERLDRRLEARQWLREHAPARRLPSMDTPEGAALHREWEATLASGGWSVVQWPTEFGGRDYDLLDWLLFEEEYFAAGAPARINHNGLALLGATLIEHGSAEQQERLLPDMVNGTTIWAQAWSEPGAGSDLASVSSKATPVEGGYLLNGQKTWSSRSAVADRGFGLFRSDPASQRHRGLTYLMFDLHGPGVEVRPIRRFDGDPVFAEIFFDDAFVPEQDVIGEPNSGWNIAMSTSAKERGVSLRSPGRFLQTAHQLLELWKSLPESRQAVFAEEVRTCWAIAQSYRMTGFLTAEGRIGAEQASVGKIVWSELDLRMHDTALRILDDLRGEVSSEVEQHWLDGHRFALAGPIYAGTNQIQKNIIAERLLGMPKGA